MGELIGIYDSNSRIKGKKEYYTKVLNEMKARLRVKEKKPADVFFDENICTFADKEGSCCHYVINGYNYVVEVDGNVYHKEDELIQLYLRYGRGFIGHIKGNYSIVIYDGKLNELILYRDCVGSKPLFYTKVSNQILFASQIKELFGSHMVEPVFDKASLNEIIGMGPARTVGSGVYKGIKEVEAGHYLVCNSYGEESVEYYRLENKPHKEDYKSTIRNTRRLLINAVEQQLGEGVQVCSLLSGGIDSSVVTAIAAERKRRQGDRLVTYSFDFKDNDKYFVANAFQPSEDRQYVKEMVDKLDTDHRFLTCDMEMLVEALEESVEAHDLPAMADVDSSLIYFCKEVSKEHVIALTGECADEIFGGYPWFNRLELIGSRTFPWTVSIEPRKSLLRPEIAQYLEMESFIKKAYDETMVQVACEPRDDYLSISKRRICYLNIKYFMQTLLNRMDRAGRITGIDGRIPFADIELMEYVYNVPWAYKNRDGIPKNLLREAAADMVPDNIRRRKKSPYPKTYNPYYEGLLSKKLLEILEDSTSIINTLYNREGLENFVSKSKDYSRPWYGQLMSGPQYMAYLIQLDYCTRKYNVKLEL